MILLVLKTFDHSDTRVYKWNLIYKSGCKTGNKTTTINQVITPLHYDTTFKPIYSELKYNENFLITRIKKGVMICLSFTNMVTISDQNILTGDGKH